MEGAENRWEIVQAATVELVTPGRYRLTRLLRGQRGTEWAMGSPAPAGARVVVIDNRLSEIETSLGDIGVDFEWRIGPLDEPYTATGYAAGPFTPQGRGLVCFSPVHARLARISGTDDLRLGWIRRDRDPVSDSWTVATPMSERNESYDVEILSADGLSVLRTVNSLTLSELDYPAAQQVADFGMPVSTLRVRIYQVGALGRGTPLDATVPVSRTA